LGPKLPGQNMNGRHRFLCALTLLSATALLDLQAKAEPKRDIQGFSVGMIPEQIAARSKDRQLSCEQLPIKRSSLDWTCSVGSNERLDFRIAAFAEPKQLFQIIYTFASAFAAKEIVDAISNAYDVRALEPDDDMRSMLGHALTGPTSVPEFKRSFAVWKLSDTLLLALVPFEQDSAINSVRVRYWRLGLLDLKIMAENQTGFEAAQRKKISPLNLN
jgi:hypothetical protein